MSTLSTIKINNLIHEHPNTEWYSESPPSFTSASSSRTSSRASSTSSQSSSSSSIDPPSTTAVYPPNIININNLEPLRLAKKKHYIPSQTALKIQKKTGSSKPQGRPFNDTLNARFLSFNSIDDLIANLLNVNDQDTIRLMKQFPVTSGDQFSNQFSFQDQLINGIIESSKELNLKKIEDTAFQQRSIEFEKFDEKALNIHNELCQIFGLADFSFVKIIRNNKGRLVKFEILSNIPKCDIGINFIKKFITYPRYKSKMKIFMISCKFDQDVWFYNDLRMLFWDIENHQVCHKKVLINNKILDLDHI